MTYLVHRYDKYVTVQNKCSKTAPSASIYEGSNFNSGNYLFTTDTK